MTSTTVGIHLDETALIECRTEHDFDWIRVADFPSSVDLFLGPTDEVAVHNADRLIEALNQARTAALSRLARSAA